MAFSSTVYFADLLPKTSPGNNPTLPSDFGSTGQGQWRNLFFPGEAITLPVSGGLYSDQPAPTAAIASWQVRNYAGTVVASGGPIAAGVHTLTIPAQPLGWYRVYFSRSSSISLWGTDAGGGMFAVVPADKTGMRPRPTLGTVPTSGLYDHGTRGMIASATTRMSVNQNYDYANIPMSNSYPSIDADLALNQAQILPYDTGRPKPTLINFGLTEFYDQSQAAAVATTVQRYNTVTYFEGTNEPLMTNTLYQSYQNLYAMVKAGRSTAKVCGPCPVSIGNADVDSNIRQFFTTGGGNYIDAVSWHQYNGVNGDLLNGRKTLDFWVSVLAQYGQQNKPRLISEAGHFFTHNFGAFTPKKQAHWTLLEMMLIEQYGIPKENYFYYYDINGGYEAQPGFMLTVGGLPFPVIPILRVYGQELYGAPYESRLDFGTVDNNLAIGNVFRRSDGTGTAALMSAGVRALPVIAQLPTGVTSVQVVDSWGNVTTQTVTGGLLPLTLGMTPIYVRLPAGATFTIVATNYGTNWLSGRTPTATSSPGADLAKLTDGSYQNPYQYGAAQDESFLPERNVWESDPLPVGGPQTVTVPLATAQAVSAVIVHAPPPHQRMSRPLDYDVQVQQASTWTTVATYTDAPLTLSRRSTSYDGGNSFADLYDDEEHAHLIRFTRQTSVTGVRLVVRGVTTGSVTTTAAATAYGQTGTDGLQIGTGTTYDAITPGPRLMLQELSAYDAPVVAAADPGTPVTPPVTPSGTKYLVLRIT